MNILPLLVDCIHRCCCSVGELGARTSYGNFSTLTNLADLSRVSETVNTVISQPLPDLGRVSNTVISQPLPVAILLSQKLVL